MSDRETARRKSGMRTRKLNTKMRKKLAGLFLFVVLALICLLIRLTYINATKGEQYTRQVLARSQSQYSSTAIAYKRGDILDRNGTVLATSEKCYNVILDCSIVNSDAEDYTEPTVAALVEYFGLDEEKMRSLLTDEKTASSKYQIVKRDIKVDEKQAYDEYKDGASDESLSQDARTARSNTKGIWFEEEYVRSYPMNALAGDVIGFVYDTDKADWGLESYYNNTLSGVDGRKYGYFGSDTEIEQTIVDPVDGNSIHTTLDMNIQSVVENTIARFENAYRSGPNSKTEAAENVGVIVMNPNDGSVYAMASDKEFDPNNPRDLTSYYTEAEIEAMSADQQVEALNGIWRNFCISDSYEPGSVFKPMTVSSALETGAVSESDTFYCDGSETVSGTVIRCSKEDGHGEESLSDVIRNSCNDAAMQIGASLGVDNFCRYLTMFGFGSRTGIDLSGEASGIILDSDTMGSVELATSSFGQGFTCTMIQEAAAVSAVINGGYYYKPHVVSTVTDADGKVKSETDSLLVSQILSGDVSDDLRSYMKASVDEGTSQYAKVDGYTMGGKTGTAQKIPRGNGKYLDSWIGFAPYEDPQVLIYVVVDEPNVEEQADNRYPQWIARDILEEILPYMGIYQDETSNPDNVYLSYDLENGTGDENSDEEENDEDSSEVDRSGWYYNDTGDLLNADGHMIDNDGYLINDDREYVDENDNVVSEDEKTRGTGSGSSGSDGSPSSDMVADTNVPEVHGTEDESDTEGGNTMETDGYTNEEAGVTGEGESDD